LLLCSIKGDDLGTGQEAKNSVRFAFVQIGFTPRQVSASLTG
jgi:hypothetical protein